MKKEIIYRFKETPSITPSNFSSKNQIIQVYFTIRPIAIQKSYISINQKYEIYIVKPTAEHNIQASSKKELQQFLPLLEGFFPFDASPTKGGSQYRLNVPKSHVKDNYFIPKRNTEYWIYFLRLIDD